MGLPYILCRHTLRTPNHTLKRISLGLHCSISKMVRCYKIKILEHLILTFGFERYDTGKADSLYHENRINRSCLPALLKIYSFGCGSSFPPKSFFVRFIVRQIVQTFSFIEIFIIKEFSSDGHCVKPLPEFGKSDISQILVQFREVAQICSDEAAPYLLDVISRNYANNRCRPVFRQ